MKSVHVDDWMLSTSSSAYKDYFFFGEANDIPPFEFLVMSTLLGIIYLSAFT